ncbi:MAG: glycosyltransferase family 4 protein [Actinomycetota bacterium]|nr:glycosyltransferase family 4 protein [Actinomycetota bacterium]
MRLLIVTNDYPPKPGGIQMYLQNLVDAYPDPVHVVAPSDDEASSNEMGVTRGHKGYMLPTAKTYRLVAQATSEFRPDAILFGAPHPLTPLGPKLREEFDVPFGILSHGGEVTLPGAVPLVSRWLGKTLAAADVRFAVSRFTADKVAALSHAPVTFLGAGVEVATFTPPATPLANSKPVIGCVSRFVPRKGQDRLIEAVAMLDIEVQLLLVGKGRTEKSLRKKAEALGVDARFEIDVPWSDLADLYRQMDVFVMPCRSRWGGHEIEGLGLVFLEAASTGLPVIAGDSGGSPETVIAGKTGYVATKPVEIAALLSSLLADRQKASTMGLAGREFVTSEFTWDRVVSRLRDGFSPHLR